MNHTLRLVHSQTENLFHFNWCSDCCSYDVVREARRIHVPEGPIPNVVFHKHILSSSGGKRSDKEFMSMDEKERKKILDRHIAIERGKKAVKHNLNLADEEKDKTKNYRHQGYSSASKKMPCLSPLQQQQSQQSVAKNNDRETLGGSLPLNTSTFQWKTAAEKETDAYEERESERQSSSGQNSDIQSRRYLNAAVRFQDALEKEYLEKKYAETLETLRYAEKLYRKKRAVESSKPPVQPNANMCPPLDQKIQEAQEQEMEHLLFKKCPGSKVLEHVIEDLEGYHDDIEEHFQPGGIVKAAESSDSLEDLDLASLRKSDSFINMYFQSKKYQKRESSTKEVQTSLVDEVSRTLHSSKPVHVTMDKPTKKNISVQAEPCLSEKCVQAEMKEAEESKVDSQRDSGQAKINKAGLSDVLDLLKHIASMPELRKLIQQDDSSSSSSSIAPVESDSNFASTSTRYHSLPQVIGYGPSSYPSRLQNKKGQDSSIRNQRQISEEASAAAVSKRLQTIPTDTHADETDVKRPEPPVFYPPLSYIVDSDPDLFSYLRLLSTESALGAEDKENIPNNSKQAIPLSEPIRERPHTKEKPRHTFGRVGGSSAQIPGKVSLNNFSSEDIVKAQQRECFIRESIKKVMSTTSGDLGGSAKVPQDELGSNEILAPARYKSEASLSSLQSSSSSSEDKYKDLSLIPNLSFVDIAQESNNNIQVEEKSALNPTQSQVLQTAETSTKNFKILEQVLKNRLKDLPPPLENKSYSTGQIDTESEKSIQSIIEEQKKAPFIYHDLSTIQEADSILTNSPSTSYGDKHSSGSPKISRKSLSLQELKLDRHGLYSINPPDEKRNSPLSVSSHDPSEAMPSTRKVVDRNTETSNELYRKPHLGSFSNSATKIVQQETTKGSKNSIIEKSASGTQTESQGFPSTSQFKTPIIKTPINLTKNLLIDAANSMMNSDSLKQTFWLSSSIGEISLIPTTKSSSLDSSEHTPKFSSTQSAEQHGTNVKIPTSSSSESNFQALSLISDVGSTPSQSSGTQCGIRLVNKQMSTPSNIDSSSESSFQPLTLIADPASVQSQRYSRVSDKHSFVPRNVMSSPNLSSKPTDSVATKDNLLTESVEKTTEEALLSDSAGSYKPLGLVWSGSINQSLNSFLKPVAIIGTQPNGEKIPGVDKSTVATVQAQHQEYDTSSRSFLPLTPVVGCTGPSGSDVLVSQQRPSSRSSNSRFISLATLKRMDALKDLNRGNAAYCSSSDDNLSEMFTGSRIFHQSTPIKEYEDPPEEKGILDEPDLTLVGSSIDTTDEICKSFVSEKDPAQEQSGSERTIVESESKTRSAKSETDVPHVDDVYSESVMSFLQHEKTSLPSENEQVSLASSTNASPSKTKKN